MIEPFSAITSAHPKVHALHDAWGQAPWLHFHGILRAAAERGALYLNDYGSISAFPCRTSVMAKQEPRFFGVTGGPLPPSSMIVNQYSLDLMGYFSAKCESNFYHLFPDPILWNSLTKKSWPQFGERKNFGLHRDGGKPGSEGCPVVHEHPDEAPANFFNSVEKILQSFREMGLQRIPFYCTYFDPRTEVFY